MKNITNNNRFELTERCNNDKKKWKIVHPWDGRFIPLSSEELFKEAKKLVKLLDTSNADYIVGFAEGGLIPAFAVSMVCDLPLIGSYRVRCKREHEMTFTEPHSERPNHFIYGLKPNDRIIIIEDEITTGNTLINAMECFQQHGVDVVDIGTFILVETPESKLPQVKTNWDREVKYLYSLEEASLPH
ncbi:MAG: phosphoribosyltransferase domain-containing protein [Methylococcales bacterium]|nr:phosphoribosyltransferase domain-containing protein [Methylococcales bacterium]